MKRVQVMVLSLCCIMLNAKQKPCIPSPIRKNTILKKNINYTKSLANKKIKEEHKQKREHEKVVKQEEKQQKAKTTIATTHEDKTKKPEINNKDELSKAPGKDVKNNIETTQTKDPLPEISKQPILPSTQRSIILKNVINQSMITYDKHWAKPVPSTFKLRHNGKDIDPGKNTTIEVSENNTIKVAYECEFKKFGVLYHRENREVEFKVAPDKKDCTIQFSWDDDYRLNITDAQPLSYIDIDKQAQKNHVS